MTTVSAASPMEPGSDGLFARAQAGDQEAWKDLFDTCYVKVVRVVRRKLDQQYNPYVMRSLYDSTDIANDVWKSLAAKSDRFDFPSVDQLMAFLIHAAEQRVIDEYRKIHARKRGENRKRSLSRVVNDQNYPLPAQTPTPSQVAQAHEASDLMSAAVPKEIRDLITRKTLGDTNEEAASYLNWTVRKVQRVLKNLAASFDTRSHRPRAK